MITRTGIEGGAIYALSADLREAVCAAGQATLHIALRPDLDIDDLIARLSAPRGKAIALELAAQGRAAFACRHRPVAGGGDGIRRAAVVAVAGAIWRELINAVPVKLNGIAPIARAISTAGGISFDELDADFMLRRLPGVFAAGEMLDWEAPTGGYLLQASFATGAAAGQGALKWLETSRRARWVRLV